MRLTKNNKAKYLTEGRVRELIDTLLRDAVAEQSREVETHLNDIHRRLQHLERRGKK